MKNFIIVAISLVALMIVSCIYERPKKEKEIPYTDKIQASIKEGTLTNTSATIIIKDLTGTSSLFYDGFYILKYVDGKWIEPDHNSKIVAGIPYHPDQNGFLELDCYWEQWYGELPKGIYRLIKNVYLKKDNIDERGSFDAMYEQFKFFVQFEIND